MGASVLRRVIEENGRKEEELVSGLRSHKLTVVSCPAFLSLNLYSALIPSYIIGLLCARRITVPANRAGIAKKAHYREIVVGKPSDPLTREKLVKPLAYLLYTNANALSVHFPSGQRRVYCVSVQGVPKASCTRLIAYSEA